MDDARRAKGRIILFFWPLICAVGTSGCALPQYAEHYFFERDGAVVADAWRYAGNWENPVDELRIDIRSSPIFNVRLPDGVWVSSREATSAKLAQHGLEIAEIGETEHAIWHPAFTLGALVGRHAYMDFYNNATILRLGACGWSIKEVVRTPDGKCAFGFPAELKDLECLFGPPSSVEKIAIVTGFSCF